MTTKAATTTSPADGDASGESPHVATPSRLIDIAAVAVFAVLAAAASYRFLAHADLPGPLVLAAVLAAWVATDLFSGLVHWAFDSFGSIRTPILGRQFIQPFREHHVDEHAITRHGFAETNGASCLAALPAVGAAALVPLASPAWAFAQAFLLFSALGVLATNQCHKWAHSDPDRVPRLARLAQRLRLVLGPEEHRRHHVRPFDTHYCTASGWLNALLNALLKAWR
jgi:hypothetical protein